MARRCCGRKWDGRRGGGGFVASSEGGAGPRLVAEVQFQVRMLHLVSLQTSKKLVVLQRVKRAWCFLSHDRGHTYAHTHTQGGLKLRGLRRGRLVAGASQIYLRANIQ